MARASFDLLNVIEAIYREEKNERAWMEGILLSAKPALEKGCGILGFPFDTAGAIVQAPWVTLIGTAPEIKLETINAVLSGSTQDDEITEAFRSVPCATASEVGLTNPKKNPGWQTLNGFGVFDSLAINAFDTTGRGLWVGAFLPAATKLRPKFRSSFGRVAAHLGVGQRYRRLVKDAGAHDAVFDAKKLKLVHAEGDAQESTARAALARAVIAVDRARGKQRYTDADGALAAWKGLVSARWSLVDKFESDGKRYIIARENEPISPPIKTLSKREAQVVGYLVLGHTAKLIAYELGISDSTVRVLLHRATRKMGTKSQRELIAAFVQQASALRPSR